MSTHKARRKPVAAVGAPERAGPYTLEDQVGFLLRCAHQHATEVFNAVMGALQRDADAVRRARQDR